ncbi:MAG: DUF1800 domain-containing protein [Planctomycetes bacterium]|nr:DUF1800 domain-containing protein [Planctomycetota bacterium]
MIGELERRIAHLHRRAGFGSSRAELAAAVKKGWDANVEELLNPEKVKDPLDDRLKELEGELFDLTVLEDAQAWWLYRMLHTRRPLEEKLTLFWHGHFATAASKVERVPYMLQQNRTLRAKAFGRFEDLLLAVAQDAAMIVWLDNGASTKKKPNENFGRELLELFTLGIGHYGEDDVKAAARAFTGWRQKDGEFAVDAKEHDDEPKTLFGQTWPWKGEDVLGALARQPATAARLARKLVRYFVRDDGDTELEAELAREYLASGGEVRAVLRALFLSPRFVSPEAMRAKVKSPCEFVVGAMRELDATVPIRSLPPMLARMGQALFNPPNVAGWNEGLAWINTATLFERANFANHLATQRGVAGDGRFEPGAWVAKDADAGKVLDTFASVLLGGEMPRAMRAALAAYLAGKDKEGKVVAFKATPQAMDEKVRGVVRLIVASPEYQLA